MEKSIGIVIFYLKKKVPHYLILKYQVYNQEHYDFIKGRVEYEETIIQTAKRELKEETGISKIEILKNFQDTVTKK